MSHYGMSFGFFILLSVVGNAVGAFASLLAGLADRWGRANLVVYGLLVTGLLVLGLPHDPAATAIGLAVWGWILRIVVACSAAFVPVVVTSVTPLVEHGHEVRAASEQAAPALAVVKRIRSCSPSWAGTRRAPCRRSFRRAREDAGAHQRAIEKELAALGRD